MTALPAYTITCSHYSLCATNYNGPQNSLQAGFGRTQPGVQFKGGVTTNFIYSSGTIVDMNVPPKSMYVQVHEVTGTQYTPIKPASAISGIPSTGYYFVTDHLGTPQQLIHTDGAGNADVVWAADYDPFGRLADNVGTDSGFEQPLRYSGQYEISQTGLHYNWHRYYDPDSGRYVSSDSVVQVSNGEYLQDVLFGPRLHHPYVYAANNPLYYFDINGLDLKSKYSFRAEGTYDNGKGFGGNAEGNLEIIGDSGRGTGNFVLDGNGLAIHGDGSTKNGNLGFGFGGNFTLTPDRKPGGGGDIIGTFIGPRGRLKFSIGGGSKGVSGRLDCEFKF